VEFRIIHRGSFSANDIEMMLLPGKRQYASSIRKFINEAWQEARLNPELNLFNGSVLSYLGSEVVKLGGDNVERDCERLAVTVQRTDYKSFYGTNICHSSDALRIAPAEMANAIAVCDVLETSDAMIPIGRRSNRMAEGAGFWHVPGGTLDCESAWKYFIPLMHKLKLPAKKSSALNPVLIMLKELTEELGIDPEDVTHCECIGLGENIGIHKPEFLCYFRSSLSAQEIEERRRSAIDSDEHNEMVYVPVEELQDFVAVHPFAPIGKAAISLYLERMKA